MIRFPCIPLLCIAALALSSACAPAQRTQAPAASPDRAASSAAAVTVTADDNGRKVDLAVGQELVVRLASNRTTGYAWTITDSANAVLAQQGKPDYVTDATLERKIGVGGTEIWRLKAVKTGQQTLRFEYRRPWERDAAPAKTVSYLVTVR